jgi:[acyl-carrier-protein] S-malonyltransferase
VKYAWLFPGQGAQVVGMGKALAETSAAARDVFSRADAALGFSISTLCFDGPESSLILTENTQPAIVTTSIAALAATREAYPNLPEPSFVLGHSLGEYSALVAAGALSLEDAVRLVHLRGRAMQEAVPPGQGAMAAVLGADREKVEKLCDDARGADVLSPANFNGPGQIVLAGSSEAIARATALASDRAMKVIALKVSAPFHCSLMKPAADKMREALLSAEIRDAEIPVVANVTAAPHRAAEETRRLLVEQVASPVRWEESIQMLSSAEVNRGLEIGPGKVLAGLIKRIDKAWVVKNAGEPKDIEPLAEFFASPN